VPLLAEKIEALEKSLRILRDSETAQFAAVKRVPGKPGRKSIYSLEARSHAIKLKAENPGMEAKDMMAQIRSQFPGAILPPNIKKYRDWIRIR
jgi:hypothetical protein